MLSLAQVVALADAMEPRFRALVLVATFGCPRWGEVTALHRQDVDADRGPQRSGRRTGQGR
ncbi:hypothetical protein [Krasilnikovia sp. MM14-A1259]|uniref:hypothetical protein n=1 Tax=Krasilnikovia sp. MM14-A1259 TaxID=3373539 RepID=UPI003816CBDA